MLADSQLPPKQIDHKSTHKSETQNEMVKEAELEELSRPEFWDNRYAAEATTNGSSEQSVIESFEWFRDFKKLRPFFTKHLPAPPSMSSILHLGCGTSTLTADLHTLGYTNEISVDFSQVVINAMALKYKSLGTVWSVMDVRQLDLPTASIDTAIDKGTLDAFIHGSLWDPPDDVRENVGRYVDEVARVLKPGGQWLYITYRQPHFMKPLLAREDKWSLEVEILEDPDGAGGFDYFGFILKRKLT